MAKFQVSVTVDDPADREYAINMMRQKLRVMLEIVGNTIVAIIERANSLLQVAAEMKDELFGLHPRLAPAVRLVE